MTARSCAPPRDRRTNSFEASTEGASLLVSPSAPAAARTALPAPAAPAPARGGFLRIFSAPRDFLSPSAAAAPSAAATSSVLSPPARGTTAGRGGGGPEGRRDSSAAVPFEEVLSPSEALPLNPPAGPGDEGESPGLGRFRSVGEQFM